MSAYLPWILGGIIACTYVPIQLWLNDVAQEWDHNHYKEEGECPNRKTSWPRLPSWRRPGV